MRRAILLPLLLVGLLALAACGGDDNPTVAATTRGGAAPTTTSDGETTTSRRTTTTSDGEETTTTRGSATTRGSTTTRGSSTATTGGGASTEGIDGPDRIGSYERDTSGIGAQVVGPAGAALGIEATAGGLYTKEGSQTDQMILIAGTKTGDTSAIIELLRSDADSLDVTVERNESGVNFQCGDSTNDGQSQGFCVFESGDNIGVLFTVGGADANADAAFDLSREAVRAIS